MEKTHPYLKSEQFNIWMTACNPGNATIPSPIPTPQTPHRRYHLCKQENKFLCTLKGCQDFNVVPVTAYQLLKLNCEA